MLRENEVGRTTNQCSPDELLWKNRFNLDGLPQGWGHPGEVIRHFKIREEMRRKAQYRGTKKYEPLEQLNVKEDDILKLQQDLGYVKMVMETRRSSETPKQYHPKEYQNWEPRSRIILGKLVKVEIRTLEDLLNETDEETEEAEITNNKLKDLRNFDTAANEQKKDLLNGSFGKRIVCDLFDRYNDEYFIPTHQWMPETPITVFISGYPLRLMQDFEKAIELNIYDPRSNTYTNTKAGVQFDPVEDVSKANDKLKEQGAKFESGLIEYPLQQQEIIFSIDKDYIKTMVNGDFHGKYIEEMANGDLHTERDFIEVANYGTLLLRRAQFAKKPEKEKASQYYQAASKAFSIARKLASNTLKGEELKKFNQSLLLREGDSLLRISLFDLYNRDKMSETEKHLKSALKKLQDYLKASPNDEYALTLRNWSLYHLGVFYQDVLRQPELAVKKLQALMRVLSSGNFTSLNISTDEPERRISKAEKRVTISTSEGKEEKIDLLQHIHDLSLLESATEQALIMHYERDGLQYVSVPEIVGVTGACENVDTLFKIGNRNGVTLFFTQTGQLGLEQALQVHRQGAYTVIHSGRDEELEDVRHLRQFKLAEEEFGCTKVGMTREKYNEETMFEALLQRIEVATKSMISAAVEKHGDILTSTYGRNVEDLRAATENPYLRINYEDAVRLLNENGYSQLKFGDDLKADHEQAVVKLWNNHNRSQSQGNTVIADLPVFICRYPKEIKFFNMKVSENDPRVVLSTDLILPIAGESVGASVREHDIGKLTERLTTSTMFRMHKERGGTLDDFRWYLDIIDDKNLNRPDPHAGYGIGETRVMQYILGQPDIRNCSLLSVVAQQTNDWTLRQAIPIPSIS